MGQKMAGTCYIKVNGAQLSVEGSVEIPLSTVNRETKIGSTGVVGYSETDIAPYVNLSAFVDKSFPVDDLQGDDMTVTVDLANGWVYTLREAYLVGEVRYSASDGNITLNFEGRSGSLQNS